MTEKKPKKKRRCSRCGKIVATRAVHSFRCPDCKKMTRIKRPRQVIPFLKPLYMQRGIDQFSTLEREIIGE